MKYDNMGVYVTYKKYRNKPIVLRRSFEKSIWVECPDRDLIIQWDKTEAPSYRTPHPENYDEYINLDINNPCFAKSWRLDYTMLNAITAPKKKGYRVFEEDLRRKNTTVMVDSGGFQLFAGVRDFLDPKEIVKIQAHHGDLGMVLDVPTISGLPNKLVKGLAEVQRWNTDVMMKNKEERLNLINIFHGLERKDYLPFREIVERDDILRASYSFARTGDTAFRGIRKVIEMTQTSKIKYNHVHVLGISDPSKCAPLMWMAKKGLAPIITSDSSSPIQAGISGTLYLLDSSRSSMRRVNVSRQAHPNRLITLPCGCPVCHAIRYSDIFSFVPGGIVSHCITLHNIFEHRKYIESMWNKCLESNTVKEFLSELKWTIHPRKMAETRLGLQVADVGMTEGYKEIEKRFPYHMYQPSPMIEGLFGSGGSQKKYDRIAGIIKKYRRYHGK